MSKKTLVDIIFNTTLSGDDLSEALSNLKFDNVLPQYSENKFYLDKEDTRATIHEYLLGESYYKQAYDIDRRYRETFKMRTY